MSVIYVDLGGTDYAALHKVRNFMTRREMYALGTCWVELDNNNDDYTDTFASMDAVDIRIGGKTIMVGFVDDPLIRGGKYTRFPEVIKVTGKDHSRELGDLFVTVDYSNSLTRMDTQLATIITALVAAGDMSYIRYILPGAASEPYKPYKFEDSFCLDGFRELMEQGPIADNRLYFVDDLGVVGPRNNFNMLDVNNPPRIGGLMTGDAAAAQKDIDVADGGVFSVGDGVYIFDTAPLSENNKIASIAGNTLTMVNDLVNTYQVVNSAEVDFCLNQVFNENINTILNVLEYGNGRGSNVKNYIQVTGPRLDDHWTENFNVDRSTSWMGGAGVTLANETTIKLAGSSSIKLTRVGLGWYSMALDITAMTSYDVNGIDLSAFGEEMMSYVVWNPGLAGVNVRPVLTDNGGTIIRYFSLSANPLATGYTDNILALTWDEITIPIGEGVYLYPLGLDHAGAWTYQNAGVFDWSAVTDIELTSESNIIAGSIFIDALKMPVSTLGIADEGAPYSIGNKRMLPLSLLNASSQLELDDYALSELEKQQNALTDLQLLSDGSPSLEYCGYVIKVKKDNSVGAIIDNVDFRIRTLTHHYGTNMVNQWNRDHVNELYLIRQDV